MSFPKRRERERERERERRCACIILYCFYTYRFTRSSRLSFRWDASSKRWTQRKHLGDQSWLGDRNISNPNDIQKLCHRLSIGGGGGGAALTADAKAAMRELGSSGALRAISSSAKLGAISEDSAEVAEEAADDSKKKKAMFSLGPGVDEEEEEEDDDDMARRVESASAALMFGAALSARAGTAPNLGSFAPTSDGKSHVAGDADDDSWVVIDRDTYETIKKRQREFAIESTSSWQESTRRVQKQRSGTIARVE